MKLSHQIDFSTYPKWPFLNERGSFWASHGWTWVRNNGLSPKNEHPQNHHGRPSQATMAQLSFIYIDFALLSNWDFVQPGKMPWNVFSAKISANASDPCTIWNVCFTYSKLEKIGSWGLAEHVNICKCKWHRRSLKCPCHVVRFGTNWV